jgi:hypothetical protein
VVELGGEVFAIEVKGSRNVGLADLRGLRSFAEFHGHDVTPLVLYRGERAQSIDGIDILPLRSAFARLGLDD